MDNKLLLEEADIPVILTFIDNNWNSVEPIVML